MHRFRTRSNNHLSVRVRTCSADVIDSYLLHGPSRRVGLSSDDLSAWRAMEAIHDSGRVRALGVSNVSLDQLRAFCQHARIPPRFVQNRCFAVRGWDRQIREFCRKSGILYQGFSLLTANREILTHPEIAQSDNAILGRPAKSFFGPHSRLACFL